MGEAELKVVVMLLGYTAQFIFLYSIAVMWSAFICLSGLTDGILPVLSCPGSGPPDLPQQLSGPSLQHKFDVIPPTPSDPAIERN